MTAKHVRIGALVHVTFAGIGITWCNVYWVAVPKYGGTRGEVVDDTVTCLRCAVIRR